MPPPRNNRQAHRSQSRSSGSDSSGHDRVRGDALTKHARYLDLAQQAKAAGDEIMAQSHLQYAEHWYRTAMADRRPVEPEPQPAGEGEAAAAAAGGPAPANQDRKPRWRGQRSGPFRRRPAPES